MTDYKFPATLIERPDGTSMITAFNAMAAEPIFQASSNHPNFSGILKGLREGDPAVWDMFDIANGIVAKFNQITDRVSWNGSEVLWDGDPVHSTLADQLMRALRSGNEDDYLAIARFWENLEANPSKNSREQAYEWLAAHKFQITSEGYVVGYKGMTSMGNSTYRSWHASTVRDKPSAYINGEPLHPLVHVEQKVGDVVTMPRSEVVEDPTVHCDRGLHVATFDYAGSYGEVVMVLVNPRDIVSVPSDAKGKKVRVNRYLVRGPVTQAFDGESPVLRHEQASTTWNPATSDPSYRG